MDTDGTDVADAAGGRVLDLRHSQAVQVGDNNTQVNNTQVDNLQVTVLPPRPKVHRPWMAPAPTGPMVARPDLYAALFDGVTREGVEPTTLTTAVEGAGGFGKTTLAIQLCRDPRVSARFPGGLLWATIGERSHGARLAELVGGLCEVLSGEGVKTADPQAAGGRLGELLDGREPILLVVDDVWRPEQLAPFMIGGDSCRRLVTTRNAGVAPRRGVSLLVDVMTTEQATATLTEGIGEVPRDLLGRLVAATHRWPLLLSLVNAAIIDQLSAGADVRQAVRWALGRLEAGGPTAFDADLGDEDSRSHAVEATMAVSLALLTPEERNRYLDLAVIPEDTYLPADLLFRLWRASGGLAAEEAEKLRARLVRLRLVQPGWEDGAPAVRLHDVLGAYLRHRLAEAEMTARHDVLVRAAAELLPAAAAADRPWWSLPSEARYLWNHLPRHLAQSRHAEERDALVVDLRWVAAKVTNLGSSVPVEVDLAEVHTDTAQSLRRALGAVTAVQTPGDPPSALGATLYCYLGGIPALEPVAAAYRPHLTGPQLVPARPLPDQPDPGMLRTVTGHTYGVNDCVFSPDGTLLATASNDSTVRLWEPMTGRLVRILTGHSGGVSGCAFSPDGQLLATAGHDQTARVWDAATGAEREILTGHTGPATSCAFSPDGTLLATTSQDGTVRLWEPTTGQVVHILTGHAGPVLACAFSPDGQLLATAGHDQTARTWDAATGAEREVFTGHGDPAPCCAFSPDGRILAVGSHDWKLRLWQVGADVSRLQHALTWEYTCAFSPDGAILATAGYDRVVRIWDVDPDEDVDHDGLRQTFEGHTGTVTGCAFSPDGMLLATASHDHTIRIWDVATGAVRLILTGHTDEVSGCAFSPDGTLVASAGQDDTVRLWDARDGRAVRVLTGHTGAVADCAFSPDGTLLASASHDHTIRMWDVTSGETRGILTGHTNLVGSCAFSPDGVVIASASDDGTSRVWEVATGRLRRVLGRHTSAVSHCAFAPDGALVTSDVVDRRIRLWRLGDDEPWGGVRVTSPLLHLAWHPNQPLLCAVGEVGVYVFRYLPHGVGNADA
ncbi:MAG: NB-ARC domain-containing protein [Frankia sp.]